MGRGTYAFKLIREFVRFARDRKVYWIVPLVLLLGLVGWVVLAGQAGAPLLYTLF